MRYVVETQSQGTWEAGGWGQNDYWRPEKADPALNDPKNVTPLCGGRLCSPKLALTEAWERSGLEREDMTPTEAEGRLPDCTYTHGFRFKHKTDLGTDEVQLYAEECDHTVSLVPIGTELVEDTIVLTVLAHEEFPRTTDTSAIKDVDTKLQGQYVGLAFRWIMARRGMGFVDFMGRSHMLKQVRGILYGTTDVQSRNRRFAYVEHMAAFLGYWVVIRPSYAKRYLGEIVVTLVTPDSIPLPWFDERDDSGVSRYPQVYEEDDVTRLVFRAPTRLEEAVTALEYYGLGLVAVPLDQIDPDDVVHITNEEVH